ncbi:hypothetical protein DP145_01755 [Clostridium tetani]|uniref:DUF3383 family protein n=1 Tax=Clostridium tetani TaxID=1513 RepID=UPI00100BF38B|nr:DUF3383 family protein [Clostridium tetani]RXI46089.1 hypothetical protein DP126_07835 [Clostridium tetani]RXM61481.1 hypothetical protein DP138_04670 [Clostridium tetani]RXM70306.1 hypothetical protein DP145_01755 [Clostridium tetani]
MTLPLSDAVDVSVSVGPVSSVRTNFNLALIVGTSKVIKVQDRVKTYSKIGDMTADGWKGTESEYLAAQLYFSQNPKPTKVAIGVWDKENESAVQAMTACREANSEWYLGYICGVNKEEIIEVAKYIDSTTPASVYAYTTSDSEVLENKSGSIVETLKKSGVHRTIGQFSTIEHAVMAIAGYAMGANTQTAGSAYTLKFKPEVGVKSENLTSTQVTLLKNNHCNVYINRGSIYNLFEDGVMADGTPFDEILNLDILTNNIQSAVINALSTSSKIPQTDYGMDNLLNHITAPLEKARNIGFIAPGIWNTASILSVKTGDTLSRGYMVLSDSIDEQSQADREARKSPPIYILVKLAGSIEFVSIRVYVNR